MVRILGIDPGSRLTGFGIIELLDDGQMRYINSGCIRLSHAKHHLRLVEIFEALSEVILQHQIMEAAIEDIFVDKNARSALKLGQARGAAHP